MWTSEIQPWSTHLRSDVPSFFSTNSGIGKSEGEIPTTLYGWALNVIGLMKALVITQIELLGFSMGGGAVQHAVLAAPGLIRKLILAGTRTSRTPNTVIGPRDIFAELANSITEEESKASWALPFFNRTPDGQAAAEASWKCIMLRSQDRAPHLSPELAKRQTEAFSKFSEPHPLNPYERMCEIAMPVFVANGDNDPLIPQRTVLRLFESCPMRTVIPTLIQAMGSCTSMPSYLRGIPISFLTVQSLRRQWRRSERSVIWGKEVRSSTGNLGNWEAAGAVSINRLVFAKITVR